MTDPDHRPRPGGVGAALLAAPAPGSAGRSRPDLDAALRRIDEVLAGYDAWRDVPVR